LKPISTPPKIRRRPYSAVMRSFSMMLTRVVLACATGTYAIGEAARAVHNGDALIGNLVDVRRHVPASVEPD